MLQSMKITLAITAKTKVLVKWRYKDNFTRFLRNLKVLVVWTKAEKTHQQMELKSKKRVKISVKIWVGDYFCPLRFLQHCIEYLKKMVTYPKQVCSSDNIPDHKEYWKPNWDWFCRKILFYFSVTDIVIIVIINNCPLILRKPRIVIYALVSVGLLGFYFGGGGCCWNYLKG